MSYRSINKFEIETLELQGCTADSWSTVRVKEDFNPYSVRNSHFSGNVSLGIFNDAIELEQGIYKPSGVYHSFIQNSKIEDNCLISHVKTMSNYEISKNVIIDNVGSMIVAGEAYFGNGVRIETMNEAGGRELTIYDNLTAQIAYLMVMYRHDAKLTDSIQHLIENYVDTKKSLIGIVEKEVHIINTGTIKNVFFGESARIDGANLLENGSILSNAFAHIFIGNGVSIRDFIIQSGSKVDGNSIINNCFIGQGVRIGKLFTADHSAFFANCDGYQSEVSSVFAGPYTVTHHKSTLLIAGMYSFFNAGSGTNQSNHMYKLGPVHQGIIERGSKTGSFSYLLWPSRTGAYSVIIGKHYSNFDTSDFPFSYINEANGKTKLTPAFNLCTVGTKRDTLKWARRDRRHINQKNDLIIFELFNPFTIGKILKAKEILNELIEKSKLDQEFVIYKGTIILNVMLRTSLRYYDLALKTYIGNEVINKIGELESPLTIKTIRGRLSSQGEEYCDKWVDMAGMIIPFVKVNTIIEAVKSNEIDNLPALSEIFQSEFVNYRKYSWAWCANLVYQIYRIDLNEITSDQLVNIVNDWNESATSLNNLILKDAEKEFNKNSRVGYGIDVDNELKELDFEMVRGTFNSNKFVREINDENIQINRKALALLSILKNS